MSETKDLSMLFGGGASIEMEEVILLPQSTYGVGNHVLQSSLNGIEYVYAEGYISSDGNIQNAMVITGEIKTERLKAMDWHVGARKIIDSSASAQIELRYVNDNTVSVGLVATGNSMLTRLTRLIGFKKKYTTTNLSVVIPVHNGNNIAVNSRYEISASALPASFLNADGTIKSNVIVRAEIFNNSGTGSAGWGDTGKSTYLLDASQTVFSRFVRAGIASNKIVVQTGNTALCDLSVYAGGSLGNTAVITATTCRVIAVLAGEAYTVQTA